LNAVDAGGDRLSLHAVAEPWDEPMVSPAGFEPATY
jgi:hypothetical protein